MKDQLLTLNLPTPLEDTVIDVLLESQHCEGFTASQVNGHSINTRHYSITEQVTGRQRRVQIEILCSLESANALVRELGRFAGAGIRYWRISVADQGQI